MVIVYSRDDNDNNNDDQTQFVQILLLVGLALLLSQVLAKPPRPRKKRGQYALE